MSETAIMGATSSKTTARKRNPHELPAPRYAEVVTIGQITQMLGWPGSRLRSADDILKPLVLSNSNGMRLRLYDVDRTLCFIHFVDGPVARAVSRQAVRHAVKAVRDWYTRQRRLGRKLSSGAEQRDIVATRALYADRRRDSTRRRKRSAK